MRRPDVVGSSLYVFFSLMLLTLRTPYRDLGIPWLWMAFASLEIILEAEEEGRPFGAAVVHELDRLALAVVTEQDESLLVAPFQAKDEFGPHSILKRSGITPPYEVRTGSKNIECISQQEHRMYFCETATFCLPMHRRGF